MTRRIQRLLSVPIKPAMMLGIAASAQTSMPEPSGFLRTVGLVGPVQAGRSSLRPQTVAEQAGRLFHNALVFHAGLFGGIGMPFLHLASMIAIPYLAQLPCGRKSQ
jgi:hypothetical protein